MGAGRGFTPPLVAPSPSPMCGVAPSVSQASSSLLPPPHMKHSATPKPLHAPAPIPSQASSHRVKAGELSHGPPPPILTHYRSSQSLPPTAHPLAAVTIASQQGAMQPFLGQSSLLPPLTTRNANQARVASADIHLPRHATLPLRARRARQPDPVLAPRPRVLLQPRQTDQDLIHSCFIIGSQPTSIRLLVRVNPPKVSEGTLPAWHL